MKHLDALCCDACRAKVTAIARRDREMASEAVITQAAMDRRTLLRMIETLLSSVSRYKARLAQADE
jgi:uncharacterized protein YbaR (Trm112 family)